MLVYKMSLKVLKENFHKSIEYLIIFEIYLDINLKNFL